MDFNPSKTDSLSFSSQSNIDVPILEVGNKQILNEVKKTRKHLELHLHSNGKWITYITEIITKAKKKLDILRGMMHKLIRKPRKSLEKLYLTFIHPVLEYGSMIWDKC